MLPKILALVPAVQQYEWGKVGSKSEVAKLIIGANHSYVVDDTKPYAELWMGTHSKGPNIITYPPNVSEKTLAEYINVHPESLGNRVAEQFGTKGLPFLFKVLSVNKSLSIQAHPTKEHAAVLRASDSKNYPDDNHKPEMAIALTQFEGMCGFKPAKQILQHLHSLPELSIVVGTDNVASLQSAVEGSATAVSGALKLCFSAVMACDQGTLSHQQQELYHRLKQLDAGDLSSADQLFLRLYTWFPDDVGCFVAYFLNHIILEPGEAMFLAPNLPHNYIHGDCIECMANSDNVVRAGLTPKYKDVETLVSMLEYECTPPETRLYRPTVSPGDRSRWIYDPPCPDFTVDRHLLPEWGSRDEEYALPSLPSASVVLVISGEGKAVSGEQQEESLPFQPGTTLFLPANTPPLRLHPPHAAALADAAKGHLLIYRAYCSTNATD